MRVVLAGGTGLVGSLLAPLLVEAGRELHLVQRRPSGPEGAKIHAAAAGEWPALVRRIAPEAAISALGTTWRKAGSQAGFRAVDQHLVLAFAEAARQAGARHFLLVSSVGADPASSQFYLRVKGEVERALAGLGFERLDIFRPGLLRGARGPDRRLKERLAILLSPLIDPLLRGRLDRFAAIDAALVARAMAAALQDAGPGRFVHHNRQIHALAAQRSGRPRRPEDGE